MGCGGAKDAGSVTDAMIAKTYPTNILQFD
jgi:hypothetical protein